MGGSDLFAHEGARRAARAAPVRFELIARRVFEVPVLVTLARVDGTRFPAAHRYHHVGRPHEVVRQQLWKFAADIDSDLAHGFAHAWIETAGRLAPRRPDLHATSSAVIEERCRHLAPAGIVDAYEEDFGDPGLHAQEITCSREAPSVGSTGR